MWWRPRFFSKRGRTLSLSSILKLPNNIATNILLPSEIEMWAVIIEGKILSNSSNNWKIFRVTRDVSFKLSLWYSRDNCTRNYFWSPNKIISKFLQNFKKLFRLSFFSLVISNFVISIKCIRYYLIEFCRNCVKSGRMFNI